jgi:hypothetical protein
MPWTDAWTDAKGRPERKLIPMPLDPQRGAFALYVADFTT